MLIDKIKIKVSGGKGGDGIVAFSKEKMRLGPTGGNGDREATSSLKEFPISEL